MIALLRGRVETSTPDCVVLLVGGVGYRVFVPDSTRAALPDDEDVVLRIHTHVREDAIHLFGFASRLEQELFETMLNVSGVGPKMALNVLSHLSPESVIGAISSGEVKALTKVPGVGKKTAQRVILELKDRLQAWHQVAPASDVAAGMDRGFEGPAEDVVAALVGLGYSEEEAQQAVGMACQDEPDGSVEDLLRAALRSTQKKGPA